MKKTLRKNNDARREKLLVGIFTLYVIVTMVIYTLPATQYALPYIPVALLMLASLLFPFIQKFGMSKYTLALLMLSTIFFLSYIMTPINGINEIIRNIRFFIPVIWGVYALKYFDKKHAALVLLVFAVMLGYIAVKTSIELEIDPWIARKLAVGSAFASDEINAFRLQNIGGFSFSYVAGIATLCLMWMAIKAKRIFFKIGYALLVVLGYYYIIQTMYTTLLILTTLCMLVMLFVYIKNVFARLLLSIGGVFALLNLGRIFGYVGGLLPDTSLLSTKFFNIQSALTSGDLDDLGARPALILQGLKIWIGNPIFGTGGEDTRSHSMLVEALSNSGIVGFFTLMVIFYLTWRVMSAAMRAKNLDTGLFTIAFLYIVLLAFWNPIAYCFDISIMAFFIPMLVTMMFDKSKASNQILEK